MSTHGPIPEAFREQMNRLAAALDDVLNPGYVHPKSALHVGKGRRDIGFVLLTFPFGESAPGADTINYISNADRRDMIIALKEIVARFEGRHAEETQTGAPGAKQ